MDTTVIGIDAHKNTCTIAARRWDELIDGPRTISSTPNALESLAENYPDGTFVIEACSVHEWMHDTLKDAGAEVFVCHPIKREAIERKKSDDEDAKRLARKHQVGDLTRVHVPDPEIRRVRDRIRYREFLKGKRTAFKNRVQHELTRWGFKLEPDPDTGRRPGTFTCDGRKQVLEAFPHLEACFAFIDQATEKMDQVEEEVTAEARALEGFEWVTSIPGIGAYTGAALLVEIGTIDRFDRAEQLVSYFGLDPVKTQSGDRVTDEHRISKKGTSYIRGLLDQCARSHLRHASESSLSEAYDRLLERGKPAKVATTAVMRKLVKVVFHVLRDERVFMLQGPAPCSGCRTSA